MQLPLSCTRETCGAYVGTNGNAHETPALVVSQFVAEARPFGAIAASSVTLKGIPRTRERIGR